MKENIKALIYGTLVFVAVILWVVCILATRHLTKVQENAVREKARIASAIESRDHELSKRINALCERIDRALSRDDGYTTTTEWGVSLNRLLHLREVEVPHPLNPDLAFMTLVPYDDLGTCGVSHADGVRCEWDANSQRYVERLYSNGVRRGKGGGL